jgi:hypothetical protein
MILRRVIEHVKARNWTAVRPSPDVPIKRCHGGEGRF